MLQRLGDYSDAILVFGQTRSVQAKGLIAVGAKTTTTVKHSRNEQKLLDLIPADGTKQTTADLVRKFYRGKTVPMNARITITNLLRSIKGKGIASIKTSERAGPNPIEVWR